MKHSSEIGSQDQKMALKTSQGHQKPTWQIAAGLRVHGLEFRVYCLVLELGVHRLETRVQGSRLRAHGSVFMIEG